MNAHALKRSFGEEYPAAAIVNGIRLPLHRERRFSRSYYSLEHRFGSEISRFMDGSASITAEELRQQWHTWTDNERNDFCQSCCWLNQQPDFADMLRFIMEHSGPSEWCGIAISVASKLPCDEAFNLLLRALRTSEIGRTANIGQAIALTRHPAAELVLRHHLDAIWTHEALWEDHEFLNWIAFDAITCISHLIEIGAPTCDFEPRVRRLATHSCKRNRDSCRNFLSRRYTWLTATI